MNVESSFSQIAPLVFDGESYDLWKVKMKSYTESFDLWYVSVKANLLAMISNREYNGGGAV